MNLRVETQTPRDGVAVVALSGEVDVYTSPRVKQEIVDHQKAISAIQDEARRAGVPAGWVR